MSLLQHFVPLTLLTPIFFTLSCHQNHHSQIQQTPPTPPTPPISLILNAASGSYLDISSTSFPMLTFSTDGGVTWNYAIESGKNLPTNFHSLGALNTVSCTGSLCIAGRSYNNGSVDLPMLVVSADGGVTWNYAVEQAKNLPANFVSAGSFNSTSCSGSLCVAGGFYNDGSVVNMPMLTVSLDAGLNWNYAIESGKNLPTGFTSFGNFISASCSKLLCSVSGYYSDGSNTLPMLVVSADGGVTWNYAVEQANNLPLDFSLIGGFNGTFCSGSRCVAGGSYSDGTTDWPMFVVTVNNGVTWNYAVEKAKNLPINYASSGIFNSTSCSDSLCVAGGSYSDGTKDWPMLAVTADNGVTWDYPVEQMKNFPANYDSGGLFTSVSCSGSLCTAGGDYIDMLAIDTPMLAVSTNGGLTWSYVVESGINLPTNFATGYFTSVSCSDSLCTAGGSYNDGLVDLPMLLVSVNAGATWNYVVEQAKNLPTNFDLNGRFNGVSSSNNQ